jgi:pimeloyl-ACP methyl ester carboxylesterase
MRRAMAILIVAALAIAALWALGPRVPVDTTIRFDPASIGNDPQAYLAASEATVAGIRSGLEKEIVWAFPVSRARTPLAIVYVHGFSASKGELRPLPDLVATELGANLYYTRLTGHGQDGPAMAGASVNAWVNDLAEALAIGRAIGERVVIVATSTGGGLATWAASRPELMDRVAGLVLISPNYRVRATGAGLLTMPWGGPLAELVAGSERGFTPSNELRAELWTSRYPTSATLPMAALTKLARETPAEEIAVPALFVFSDEDRIVDATVTREIAARWGGGADILPVAGADDPNHHVIAGDAYSPSTTASLASAITAWIRDLPGG